VTSAIISRAKSKKWELAPLIKFDSVLCDQRKDYVEFLAHKNYINSIVTQITKVGTQQKIDSLTKGILAFFEKYTIDVPWSDPEDKKTIAEKNKAAKICETDLVSFGEVYYEVRAFEADVGVADFAVPFSSLVQFFI
jgi:hypothetical protein